MAQHLKALEKANRVRFVRAEIKLAIDAGHIDIAQVILEPPEEVKTATVYEMLMSQHRWGRVRTMKIIKIPSLSLSERSKIGNLTDRQRIGLVEALQDNGTHEPCPGGCGGNKTVKARLCVKCSNALRRR